MKKSSENDQARLQHMLDAAQKIQQFSAGKTYEELESDEVLTLAVIRLIEIVGEAASQLTDEFRVMHPEVPWQDIIGMRNRVIHGYFAIALKIIWDTVSNDIPELVAMLQPLLSENK
jgi:uncharacterized protein with HEPN domain